MTSTIPRRDLYLIALSLAVMTALAWGFLVYLTRPSASPEYARMAREMAMILDRPWTITDAVFTFSMWTVMMIGMMSPSATPILLVYA